MVVRQSALVAVIAAGLSVACGGTSDTGKKAPASNAAGGSGAGGGSGTGGSGTGTPGCDPNAEIPCYVGKAEPCENYSSTWEGDEYCMKPPDHGYQLHVGPTDFTNPDDVKRFVLPAGAGDINWCWDMKTSNDQTFLTDQYYSHMRPGSHHQIIFALPGDSPDSTVPDPGCSSRNGGIVGGATFLSGATRIVQNATMWGDAPEDKMIAAEVPPHQQLSVNLHFVNITDHDLVQEMWVNQIEHTGPVDYKIKAIEWYGGLGMNIPPGTTKVVKGGGQNCAPGEDIRILGVTGHVHASTVRFAMYKQGPNDATPQQVFEDYNWEEPTVFTFNSLPHNSAPDSASRKPGSPIDGIFNTNPNDKYSWECEIVNQRSVNLTFSDRAYDGEMCNVFGMYASPNPQNPWLCFSM